MSMDSHRTPAPPTNFLQSLLVSLHKFTMIIASYANKLSNMNNEHGCWTCNGEWTLQISR